MRLPDLTEIEAAARLVHAAFGPTPAYAWPLLSARAGGGAVWVKHENHTPTGAFKVRGGLVFMDRLARERPHVRGVVSATRGNHGQSLAYAGARHGVAVTIVVPHGNSAGKNAAMRAQGARLVEHGADFDEARVEAMRLADRDGLEFVPSFHPDLVAGVATYALELFRQAGSPPPGTLYVPIGQGSGVCGCIAARDALGLPTEIVGVQSTEADAYARSFAERRVVETPTAATRADGMATRVPVPAAVEIIRRGAARVVTVTDAEVARAVRALWEDTHNLAEGAGAAPVAALLKEGGVRPGRTAAVILCGGNIDLGLFRDWVLGEAAGAPDDAAPGRVLPAVAAA